jgi:hypothetical protein
MFIWMPPTEAPDNRPAPGMEPRNPPSAPDFSVLPDSAPRRIIRDLAGMPMRWVRLKGGLRKTYELRCGEEILGLVRYESKFWDGPRALARTKRGTWSFRGYGSEVEIETDKGHRTLVSPYDGERPKWRFRAGPALRLPNGHDYFLKSMGFWHLDLMWMAADDTPIVSFRLKHSFTTSSEFEVEVHPPAAALPELDLLITLGLYLTLTPSPSLGGGGGGGGGGGCGGGSC